MTHKLILEIVPQPCAVPPSTIFHLGHIVAVLRRSPASVVHQDRHHAVVLMKLFAESFAGSEPGERHRAVRVSRTRRRRSNGAWIGRIGRRTYDYFLCVVSTLPLRSKRVRRQHSPLSLLCITMILRVRRNFFEITTFPNNCLELLIVEKKQVLQIFFVYCDIGNIWMG